MGPRDGAGYLSVVVAAGGPRPRPSRALHPTADGERKRSGRFARVVASRKGATTRLALMEVWFVSHLPHRRSLRCEGMAPSCRGDRTALFDARRRRSLRREAVAVTPGLGTPSSHPTSPLSGVVAGRRRFVRSLRRFRHPESDVARPGGHVESPVDLRRRCPVVGGANELGPSTGQVALTMSLAERGGCSVQS